MVKVAGFVIFVTVMWIMGAQGEAVECEMPPPQVINPGDCCKLPQFFPNQVLRKCAENYSRIEYHPPPTTPRAPPLPAPLLKSITAIIPRGCCVFECAFNVSGLNEIGGGINMMDISNYFMDIVKDETTWNETMIDALEFCVKDARSKLPGFMAIANMPPTQSGQKYCNPMPGYLTGCIHSYLFQKCPDILWRDSNECNDLREYQEKCPLPFAVKGTK
ncbi:general odorant-binding protein 66-like [Phlebotomus papatasi]|uniref:general odorant-binding protein 66-like n=1 Tax=Phlebotomus papatasi TaxID=29031 RepID=UPI0024842C33|nr:general odorant-binding protein 66-like [Phlebotomus papatasi]